MPSGNHKGHKQYIRLLEALKDGPGTSRELADELALDRRVVAAQLSQCHRDGLVTRELLGGGLYRAAYLYSVTG